MHFQNTTEMPWPGDFPGGPGLWLHTPNAGAQVQFPIRELDLTHAAIKDPTPTTTIEMSCYYYGM